VKPPRLFLVKDTREVELPNHEQAIKNVDFTNPRLRVVVSRERVERARWPGGIDDLEF
jgi:hypothetical protein